MTHDELLAWVGAVSGALAVVIAVVAALFAARSNKHARESARVAKQSEARQRERHDVFWEGEWDLDWNNPGRYVLVNRGVRDAAYNVTAIVDVDDEKMVAHRDEVGPGEEIVLDFPAARAELLRLRQEEEELQREEARQRTVGSPFAASIGRFTLTSRGMCYIRERVTWTTELGTPQVHEEGVSGFLGEIVPES